MRLVVIRSNVDSQWYVHTVADNGETLNHSEGFVRRIDAIHNAELTKPDGATIEVISDD